MKISEPEKEQISRLIKRLKNGKRLPSRDAVTNQILLRTLAQKVLENFWIMTQKEIENVMTQEEIENIKQLYKKT